MLLAAMIAPNVSLAESCDCGGEDSGGGSYYPDPGFGGSRTNWSDPIIVQCEGVPFINNIQAYGQPKAMSEYLNPSFPRRVYRLYYDELVLEGGGELELKTMEESIPVGKETTWAEGVFTNSDGISVDVTCDLKATPPAES